MVRWSDVAEGLPEFVDYTERVYGPLEEEMDEQALLWYFLVWKVAIGEHSGVFKTERGEYRIARPLYD